MTGALEVDPAAARAGLERALSRAGDGSGRLALDPDAVERDLAKLVLSVVEFLRQLMELQAIRRFEAGTLSAAEEERLGAALQAAQARVLEIADVFGVAPEEILLDLGLEAVEEL